MGAANLDIWIATAAAFGAVLLLALWAGWSLTQRTAVARRIGPGSGSGLAQATAEDLTSILEKRFGKAFWGDAETRSTLRAQLIRAGYFRPDAPIIYSVIRLGCVVALPVLVYFLALGALQIEPLFKFALLTGSLLLGYFIPEAWIKRRERLLQEEYRIAFPELLDLLVVAVDAGLSIEAGLERINSDVGRVHDELGSNLAIMMGETRAGRSTVDALQAFADRLGIEEAKSFSVLLKQSIELGSDIGTALRVYSGEMREKRMSRAEEKAMALPVKIVMPLGAFIFPVILLMVLAPALIKLASVMK
ncbi:type II secretion system F family protein [Alsobacter sp. R-9]